MIAQKQTCTMCLVEKDIVNFYPRKGRCKDCLLILQQQYRQNPSKKENRLKKERERWEIIKERRNKKRNETNRIKANSPEELQRRENNKLKKKLERAQRKIENLEKLIIRKREVRRKSNSKVRSTPEGKINHNISNALRIHLLFEGLSKGGRHWEKLVGYTRIQLKEHLEKQFTPDMTWDNYGSYWHIDHIKPKSWFRFESVEDQSFKDCWSLSNLQPLEATKNISKQDRYEG